MSIGDSKFEPKTKMSWIIKNCLEGSIKSHQKWIDYLKGNIEPETRKKQERLVGNATFHENYIQRYETSLQALEQLQSENEKLKEALKEIHFIAGTISGKGTTQASEIWDIISKALNK